MSPCGASLPVPICRRILNIASWRSIGFDFAFDDAPVLYIVLVIFLSGPV